MQPIIATIKAMALTKTIHELEARRHRASRREAGEIAPGKWQMDGQLAVRIEERAKEWAKLAKHDDAATPCLTPPTDAPRPTSPRSATVSGSPTGPSALWMSAA